MTNAERHQQLCRELSRLYERKNQGYGDSFHKTFQEYGLVMPCIRLEDKLSRLKSLALGGARQVRDESIRDTLMDLANYALMTVMELEYEEA